jgi:DNA-binding response OmpR family regulator
LEIVTVNSTALVVNGHQSERDELRYFLMQAGYCVLPTETSDEALALCRDHKGTIHLLVTDADLPGTSGWELAERATAFRPGIVILYLSGSSLSSDTDRFFGPKSYIPGTEAFRKASILRDVTQALIQKKQQKLQ